LKKAFSLIEVVFAIVIVSISLMSVPMLLKEASKSDEYSIIQESVLAASTKMGNIISYPWDDSSYDTTNKILRVLDVSSGDSELDRYLASVNQNYRIGHVVGDQRRRFFDSVAYPGGKYPTSGTATLNNISAFNGQSFTIGGSGAYDYKDASITMVSKVYYISDATDYSLQDISITLTPTSIATSTNIKVIELNTTSPMLSRSFILRTFMCNIGQSNLLVRTK